LVVNNFTLAAANFRSGLGKHFFVTLKIRNVESIDEMASDVWTRVHSDHEPMIAAAGVCS
jgi:hypothetical protein